MTLSEWRAYVQNAYEEGRMLPSRQWSILIDLVLKLGERVQWDAPPLKSFVDSLCEEMKHAFDKTDEMTRQGAVELLHVSRGHWRVYVSRERSHWWVKELAGAVSERNGRFAAFRVFYGIGEPCLIEAGEPFGLFDDAVCYAIGPEPR